MNSPVFRAKTLPVIAITRPAVLALALLAGACAAGPVATSGPAHDAPVAASEPRAELRLKIDLHQRAGCEEDFDLALYEDFGVELIEWREPLGVCKDRHAVIRYLPNQISRDALMRRVQELSHKVETE